MPVNYRFGRFPDQYPVRLWEPGLTEYQVACIDRWLSYQPEKIHKWVASRGRQYDQMGKKQGLLRAKMDICEWQFEDLNKLFLTYEGIDSAHEYWNQRDTEGKREPLRQV